MRVRLAVVALCAAGVAFHARLGADLSQAPRWSVFVPAVYGAVERNGTVYIAGEFTHVYRPNTSNDQILDSLTGEVKPGCARRTDPGTFLQPVVPDAAGGLFLPRFGAFESLTDGNGAFQPTATTTFLRIRPDCSFDRVFQPSSIDPARPNSSGAGSLYNAGSFILATSRTIGTSTGVPAQIAAFDPVNGQRLAFREYAQTSYMELLGAGAPGTVVALMRSSSGDLLAHVSLASLDVVAQGPLGSFNRRYWYRAGRVFVWEEPPSGHTGDWLKPIESVDAATLQPAAGWTSPVPHGPFNDRGIVTDIEVVGNRVFVGGTNRVNGQTLPWPAALVLSSGLPDATWSPPTLTQLAGASGTPEVGELATDGSRLFFRAANLGRVGASDRVWLAALDATTGALDAWDPKVWSSSGAFHYFAGGVFVEQMSAVDGQERRFLAALDAGTGDVTPWNPNVTPADARPVAAITASASYLYVSTSSSGTHRITLDTGVRDATWGLSPSARTLAFDGSTLYMGGSFQAMSGAGCGTSFPLTARRGAAAMNLATCQLTNWNPNLHGPASTDGVYSMALAGQTMVMGGNFTTASHGAIGLIGVNLTDGAATVAPLPGLTSVSAVATDGARAFAYGMSGATPVLAALNPGGAPTAVQASFDPFASPRMAHFGGRIYAGRERDEVTLQPTAFPQQFSRAFRMATGVLLVSGDNTTAYYPLAQPAAPNPPQNLTAHTSGNIVTLGWSPPAPATGGDHPAAGAAASYVVRAGSGTGLSNLADFDTGSLTTGLTASAPSGRYYVRVHARNAIGLSSPSNEVQVTLGPPACTSPPAAPGPLAATVAGLSVTFTWGPAANATSYVLEAGAAAGGRGLAVVNVGATPTFRASAPAGVYYVRVRGSNACGVGPASNEVIVTLGTPVVLPGPPANLTVTRSGSAVTLAWSPPTSGGSAASYVLAAGTAPGLSDIVVVPLTSTTVSANAPPGSYFVRVHAVNAAGQGPPSNEVRVDVP